MKKMFLAQSDSPYPASLKEYFSNTATVSITALGNIENLLNNMDKDWH